MEIDSIDELIRLAEPKHPVEIWWITYYDETSENNTFLKASTVGLSGEEISYIKWRDSEMFGFPIVKTIINYYKTVNKLKSSGLKVDTPYLL